MAWLFWGPLIVLLGGMLILSILSRRRRRFRRSSPRPPISQILSAFGHALVYALWSAAPRHVFWRNQTPVDPSKDYAREYERDRDETDRTS